MSVFVAGRTLARHNFQATMMSLRLSMTFSGQESQGEPFYKTEIQKLYEQRNKCIEVRGDYVEKITGHCFRIVLLYNMRPETFGTTVVKQVPKVLRQKVASSSHCRYFTIGRHMFLSKVSIIGKNLDPYYNLLLFIIYLLRPKAAHNTSQLPKQKNTRN